MALARNQSSIPLLLRFACFFMFAGVALIHRVSPPNYGWFGAASTTPAGIILVLVALFSLIALMSLMTRPRGATAALLVIGGLAMIYFHIMRASDGGWTLSATLSPATRTALPWLALAALMASAGSNDLSIRFWARVAIACTFLGHGLKALGWPSPTPGGFFEMTTAILPLTPDVGVPAFLKIIGILDIIAALGLFYPPIMRSSALYMILWGIFTCLARPIAYFDSEDPSGSLARWIPEAIYRAPHFLIPIYLRSAWGQKRIGRRLNISAI